ncbi:MAG: helix-turn-helix transcriptional regulator [Clostridia bacterium]|nr:helix-turn-helix transcriptional regulator [Clostridia bacterium]
MKSISFINAGYNVAEPRRLHFKWALNQYAFLYFQGPVMVSGKEYGSGSCILYKTGTPHDYITLKGFVNSYIGFNAPDEIFSLLDIKLDKVIFPNNCDEINDILFNICRENSMAEHGYEISLKARILDLLVAISRGTNPDYKTHKTSDIKNRISVVRSEFLSDIVSPPEFETLLIKHGFSRTQGFKYYSQFFHSSPKEDLIWARLEKSRNLMKLNPDMKIYEIAEQCGFSNIPHFFRIFKTRYGCTPKDYINALKLDNE